MGLGLKIGLFGFAGFMGLSALGGVMTVFRGGLPQQTKEENLASAKRYFDSRCSEVTRNRYINGKLGRGHIYCRCIAKKTRPSHHQSRRISLSREAAERSWRAALVPTEIADNRRGHESAQAIHARLRATAHPQGQSDILSKCQGLHQVGLTEDRLLPLAPRMLECWDDWS